MNHTPDPATEHPTDLPCPTWCQQPPRHPLIEDWPGAGLSRTHTHLVARKPFKVTVEHYETALTPHGPTDRDCPAETSHNGEPEPRLFICLATQGGDILTGPQARDLAAVLTAAADAWDLANHSATR